jgi:hypothetical protein
MELVVVSWGLRLMFLALAGVVTASLLSGATIIDAVVRGVAVAFVFTFATGWLLDRLEPQERRLLRLRAKRAAKRDKGEGKGKGEGKAKGDPASGGKGRGKAAKDGKGKEPAGTAPVAARGRAA